LNPNAPTDISSGNSRTIAWTPTSVRHCAPERHGGGLRPRGSRLGHDRPQVLQGVVRLGEHAIEGDQRLRHAGCSKRGSRPPARVAQPGEVRSSDARTSSCSRARSSSTASAAGAVREAASWCTAATSQTIANWIAARKSTERERSPGHASPTGEPMFADNLPLLVDLNPRDTTAAFVSVGSGVGA
jgi:hypothetical protein